MAREIVLAETFENSLIGSNTLVVAEASPRVATRRTQECARHKFSARNRNAYKALRAERPFIESALDLAGFSHEESHYRCAVDSLRAASGDRTYRDLRHHVRLRIHHLGHVPVHTWQCPEPRRLQQHSGRKGFSSQRACARFVVAARKASSMLPGDSTRHQVVPIFHSRECPMRRWAECSL